MHFALINLETQHAKMHAPHEQWWFARVKVDQENPP
jgi:hypothetical protein